MIQKRDAQPEDDATSSPGDATEPALEAADALETAADTAAGTSAAGPPSTRASRLAALAEAESGSGEPSADDAGSADADAPGDDPGDELDAELAAEVAAELGESPGDDAADGAAGQGSPEEPAQPGRPLTHRVEAILFAAAAPLAPAKLARVLDEPLDDIKAALEELVTSWSARSGAIDLVAIAGGWRFMTRPEFQADLAGMAKKGKVEKLSPAALETLAIVAYKQPLTRVEVEGIRGVAAGPLLRVLLDRDLIRVSGRSPEPGHPLLYGTTKRFLDHFGLDSLRSLPDIKDLLDVS